jgi:hypothetical protein
LIASSVFWISDKFSARLDSVWCWGKLRALSAN